MKKRVILYLLLSFIMTGLFGFDEDVLNRITFINKTGVDIWYIFLSPGDSGEWGFDILGSERMLSDNSLLSFYISYPDYENYFDIMAIDSDGNAFILYDELISDDGESDIIIREGDLNEDYGMMDFVEVAFTNDTDYEMYYTFISPSDSQMWGVDMMDDEQTLPPGETLTLLAPLGEYMATYDLMAVDTDLDEYQFSFDIDPDSLDTDESLSFLIEYGDLVSE